MDVHGIKRAVKQGPVALLTLPQRLLCLLAFSQLQLKLLIGHLQFSCALFHQRLKMLAMFC
jgi:hypothetical protein